MERHLTVGLLQRIHPKAQRRQTERPEQGAHLTECPNFASPRRSQIQNVSVLGSSQRDQKGQDCEASKDCPDRMKTIPLHNQSPGL